MHRCVVPDCAGELEFGGGHGLGGQPMHSHSTCHQCGVVYTKQEGGNARPDHRETVEVLEAAQEAYERQTGNKPLTPGTPLPRGTYGDLEEVTGRLELAERGLENFARWEAARSG